MTKSNDGWIEHDGVVKVYPHHCIKPDVRDGDMVEVSNGFTPPVVMVAGNVDWRSIRYWRRAVPVAPGPSDFVRETAARIMAALITNARYNGNDSSLPTVAVDLALALEKALQETGQ